MNKILSLFISMMGEWIFVKSSIQLKYFINQKFTLVWLTTLS